MFWNSNVPCIRFNEVEIVTPVFSVPPVPPVQFKKINLSLLLVPLRLNVTVVEVSDTPLCPPVVPAPPIPVKMIVLDAEPPLPAVITALVAALKSIPLLPLAATLYNPPPVPVRLMVPPLPTTNPAFVPLTRIPTLLLPVPSDPA
ncbi:MAG: Uncharacterized protein FD130_22 [Halothiobacillaceae bacterium]|nr:MAG: Uncharacterized protein FD130_22 [Halothiobacillaceae bacterium]